MPPLPALRNLSDDDAVASSSNAEVAARLAKTDWDFRVRAVRHEVESVHPYPAKFIPDLPGALLDALSLPLGSIVMDPFCGSGTTLSEGQRRGYSTLGIDLNPIACLIARVKTRPLPDGITESIARVSFMLEDAKPVIPPAIPNLAHWFKPSVQLVLTRLMQAIDLCPLGHRDFLRLAASSIVVRVSNQESDTRYAAIDKGTTAQDVVDGFERACSRLHEALSARGELGPDATVLEGDILSIKLPSYRERVSAIITSPPYPNAYEYWLYHKYRIWWLGHDPLAVRAKEIGARAHFFGGRGDTADTFSIQMASCFTLFKQLLRPGGWVCFVVGRSVVHGRVIDNAAVVREAGEMVGLDFVFQGARSILSTRKSFNLKHANIKEEQIVVLRSPAP